jgi:hypothetical protein
VRGSCYTIGRRSLSEHFYLGAESWLQPKNRHAGAQRGSGLHELRRGDVKVHPAVRNRALAKLQYVDGQHPDGRQQPQSENPPPKRRARAGNPLRENRERLDPNPVSYRQQLSESPLRQSHSPNVCREWQLKLLDRPSKASHKRLTQRKNSFKSTPEKSGDCIPSIQSPDFFGGASYPMLPTAAAMRQSSGRHHSIEDHHRCDHRAPRAQ